MSRLLGFAGSVLPAGLLVLCTQCASPAESTVPTSELGQAFRQTAEETGVPESLLLAIGQVEDGLDIPLRREVEVDAEIPMAGPLALRHGAYDSLGEAAKLHGESELRLREDAKLALRAGAALLATRLDAHRAGFVDGKTDWPQLKQALAEWSGFADSWHANDYAREVLALMARGGELQNRAGDVFRLAALDVPPSLLLPEPRPAELLAWQPEFPGAEPFPVPANRAAEKYNAERLYGGTVKYLIVHHTEGGWAGSVATLQNDPGKSAHYIVGLDGRIGQFIPESAGGWHCGNRFFNHNSIGIENVGWKNVEFPQALYEASARLTNYLADKYEVPRDREHIFGHDQVPRVGADANGNAIYNPPCAMSPVECQASPNFGGASRHTDPGVWNWGAFMARLGGRAKCNDVTTSLRCDSTGLFASVCNHVGVVDTYACNDGCTQQDNLANCAGAQLIDPDAVDPGDDDAGEADGGDDDRDAGSPPPVYDAGRTYPDASPGPPREKPKRGQAEPEDEGGCAMAPGRGAGSGATPLAMALVALALVARRRSA